MKASAPLPPRGRIDPQQVRTSQRGFSENFEKSKLPRDQTAVQTVPELAKDLRRGKVAPDDIPPIQLVE